MWGAGAGTSFSVPNPGADTRTEEETIKSPHQARLLPYPPLLIPVHTGSGSCFPLVLPMGSPFVYNVSPFLSTGQDPPFVSTDSGSPFASTGTGPPFAQAPIDTARLYEFIYRHAPLPSSSLPTGSSHSVQFRSRWALWSRPATLTSPSSPAAQRTTSR